MNIEQRLKEIEKTIDAIGIILTSLFSPSKKVDQGLLDETIKNLEEMIEKRRKNNVAQRSVKWKKTKLSSL